MSLTLIKDVPSVANVQPNATMAANIAVGEISIEKLGFEISGGLLKTNLTNIDVKVDGRTVQEFDTVADLEMLQAYYGQNISAAEIALNFRRYEYASPEMSGLFNIGLADVRNFQVFAKIAAGAAAGSAIDAYKLETQVPAANGRSVAQNNSLGLFTRIMKFSHAPSAAGIYEIDTLPRQAFIQAIHLVSAGGLINSVEVLANSNIVYEASDARMEKNVEDHGRVRQANVHHIDWMLQNTLGNQLAVAPLHDFRLKLDMAGADTVTAYVEYLSGQS